MFSKQAERKFCPLIKKTCMGSDCMFAVKLRGTDPNSGEAVDDEACAIAWMPMLTIENTKVNNETGAAVESFRNEAVRNHHESVAVQKRAIGSIPPSVEYSPAKRIL